MPFLTPAATQSQINTTTALSQNNSIVRSLSNGRYIVIWTDGVDQTLQTGPGQFTNTDVRAQIFNADGTPFGGEFVVTSDPGTQLARAVIQLTDGNIVIAWQNNLTTSSAAPAALPTTSAREFTIDGTPVGAAFTIGSTTVATQGASLAPLAGGGFVASWYSGTNLGSIASQIFDSSNTAVGAQITVDSTNIAPIDAPRTTLLSNGDFLVTYRETVPGSGVPTQISGQIYSPSGAPVGLALQFGSFGSTLLSAQTLALPNGGFAILSTYREPGTNETVSQIVTYDASGAVVTAFGVQRDLSGTAAAGINFAVTPGGGFVVSWSEGDVSSSGAISDGSSGTLVAALYTADGTPIFPNPLPDLTTPGIDSPYRGGAHAFQVNVQGSNGQNSGGIAVLSSGDIVFTWTDLEATDGNGSSVQQRLFELDPANRAPRAADQFLILEQLGNIYTLSALPASILHRDDYAVAFDPDGDDFVVTAVGNPQNGSVSLSNGIISFTPTPGNNGPAIFDYTITDAGGASSTARATVVATISDQATVRANASVTISTLLNDYLPAGQNFVFQLAPNANQLGFVASSSNPGVVFFNPLAASSFPGGVSYSSLQIGQQATVSVSYTVTDPATGTVLRAGQIDATVNGWVRIGPNNGSGNDDLVGTEFDDNLIGGGGINTLTGLGGNDLYSVSTATDVIIEQIGGGTDTVSSAIRDFTLPDNVENLRFISLGNASDIFIGRGNALNNEIQGGNNGDTLYGEGGNDRLVAFIGQDTLFGGDGDDVLVGGGAGADQFYGGAGNDRFVVTNRNDIIFENAGEGIDTVTLEAVFPLDTAVDRGFYLFANVENLSLGGGSGNYYGVGNELANTLTGNAGENLLIAGAGNDTVFGGGARDAIFGEDGDDSLSGQAGIDYMVGGFGNDTLDGGGDADEIYGQEGDDLIYGGSSFDTDIMVGGLGNDTIFGNSGRGDYDLLYGNEGSDIFYVDTPDDLVFEQAGEGNDTVYADINGAGYYLYANIENLILLDDTPFGVGNDLANQMTGNTIGNYLLGGAGNDTLNGMGGDDVLFGEGGNDLFVFAPSMGNDVIGDFAQGQDRIDLSAYGLNFAQLQSRFAQDGNVGAIQFANGDVIVLHNVTMSQLTAADFILAPVSEAPAKNAAAVMDSLGAFATDALYVGSLPAADQDLHHWATIRSDFYV